MTDLADRLRDVLSDEALIELLLAAEDYDKERQSPAAAQLPSPMAQFREDVANTIAPLLLSLQEEQRREIRSMFERWLKQGYTDAGETPLDDYGQEVVREVLSSLAASSSSPCREGK